MKLIDILNAKNISYEEKDGAITIGGSLDLEGTQITELPDYLNVGGSLYLRGTQITELPDNLNVGGSLDLRGTQITELPDNFMCEELYLTAKNISNVTSKEKCGSYDREIYCVWTKGDFYIAAGCFFGTQKAFEDAVDRKYTDESAAKYKADAQDCVNSLTEILGKKAA